MTNGELKNRLDDLIYQCGMNQCYHQRTAAVLGRWDKGIRITIGILAVVGLVLAVPTLKISKIDVGTTGLVTAIVSLVAAVILNIVPVGDREKLHGELFRLWSELLKDATVEECKVCEAVSDDSADEHAFDRLKELLSKAGSLNADEPAPNESRLRRCQEDENERRWGEDIRTSADVEAEGTRRLKAEKESMSSSSASSAVGG